MAACLLALLCLAVPYGDDDPFHLKAGRERTITDAIRALSARNFDTRERAQRRLISLGEAARASLVKARDSGDAEIRHRAAVALRVLDRRRLTATERRERDFIDVIRHGLRPGRDLRRGSNRFTALELDRGAAARAAIRVAAEVEMRPAAHRLVVVLLTDLGHENAGPYLAELLARGYPLASTLHLAAHGLMRFAGRDILPLIRLAAGAGADPISRKYALRVLSVKGEAGDLPLILRAAAALDPGVRTAAARAAGLLGGRRAVASLRGLCTDDEPGVRVAAIETLGRIPSDALPDAALELLGDPDPQVRVAALEVLSRRSGPEHLPAIELLLTDPEDRVRAAAVTATARLGRPEVAALRGISDSSPRVRRVALLATLTLPPEQRRDLLRSAPEEDDPYLRTLRKHVAGTN